MLEFELYEREEEDLSYYSCSCKKAFLEIRKRKRGRRAQVQEEGEGSARRLKLRHWFQVHCQAISWSLLALSSKCSHNQASKSYLNSRLSMLDSARANNEEVYGCLSMLEWRWCYKYEWHIFDLSSLFLSTTLHVWFEGFLSISRLKSLHESCSAMSLEDFDTNLTFIGAIKCEIELFW